MTGRLPKWRDDDPEVFRGTVLAAAEHLGVQPLAVEKDYWVCEALRSVAAAYPGRVVFKGGTSLEKLRIIQRFSEDLDLLVPGDDLSNRAQQRLLRDILTAAARATGSEPGGVTAGGSAGSFHRAGYLAPPLEHRAGAGGFADPAAILVELGQSGGPNPHEPHEVTSLLVRELTAAGFDTMPWSDLAPFRVEVLHPGRTLVEKLLRVNNFAVAPEAAGPHGLVRIGRQFYDVWALLAAPAVVGLLADRAVAGQVLDSAMAVSAAIGRPDRPVPAGGFAASRAFDPGPLLGAQLRSAHGRAMESLYYGNDDPPTFDEVLATVHRHAELLDVRRQ